MPTALSILVFVAAPLDYARYRHTALFFDFGQSSNSSPSSRGIETTESTTAVVDFEPRIKNDSKHEAGTQTEDLDADTEEVNAGGATDSSVRSSLMEIVGSPGSFHFTERENSDIRTSSTNLTRIIPVSSIQSAPPAALRLIISDTPIPVSSEGESDWNSQNWVGDALERLVVAGYLDPKARDRALDEMVDAVLEASDEDIGG